MLEDILKYLKNNSMLPVFIAILKVEARAMKIKIIFVVNSHENIFFIGCFSINKF
jgi:hypothetical protein